MSGKHAVVVRKKRKRRMVLPLALLGLAVVAGLIFVFRSFGKEQPEDEPIDIPAVIIPDPDAKDPDPEPPVTPQGVKNPLTGTLMPLHDAAIGRRPVAISINNIKASLPQLGISQADIIVEMLAEGGISRLLAIYKDSSEVGRIGSVRSLRPYFLDMAQGFGAITLHFGGSVPAYAAIESRDPPHIDGVRGSWEGTLYIRDPERKRTLGLEHSVLTSGERIEDALAKLKDSVVSLPGQTDVFHFDENHSAGNGEKANRVSIESVSSNKPWFEYDAEKDRYLRFQYGKPQMDAEYGVQVGTRNLIVLQMKTENVKNSELKLITMATTGTGKGWYCCGGKAIPIKWSKAGYDKPLVLTLEDGSDLKVAPGSSFITCIQTTRTPVFS